MGAFAADREQHRSVVGVPVVTRPVTVARFDRPQPVMRPATNMNAKTRRMIVSSKRDGMFGCYSVGTVSEPAIVDSAL